MYALIQTTRNRFDLFKLTLEGDAIGQPMGIIESAGPGATYLISGHASGTGTHGQCRQKLLAHFGLSDVAGHTFTRKRDKLASRKS